VRVEHGDDGGARDEAENLAGLEGDVALNPGRLGRGLSALLVLGVFPYAGAVQTVG
jgi:hypothetical protein